MPDWLPFALLALVLVSILGLLLVVYGHLKHVVELLERKR